MVIQFLYTQFYDASNIHDLLAAVLLSCSYLSTAVLTSVILHIFPHREPLPLSSWFAINFHGLQATSLTSSPFLVILVSCSRGKGIQDISCVLGLIFLVFLTSFYFPKKKNQKAHLFLKSSTNKYISNIF